MPRREAWGRSFATLYTFGVSSVGAGGSFGGAMQDIANCGCLILWGYNPSFSRLTHATAAVEALKRGRRFIVVDPRHVGLASKADLWLRVRPGSDGGLALGLPNMMIQRGWYDREFIRTWSNGAGATTSGNATQTARTMSPRYALIGCFDAPDGNVAVPGTTRHNCRAGILRAALRGERLPEAEASIRGPGKSEVADHPQDFCVGRPSYAILPASHVPSSRA